jgi:tRNA nucleotidyltransferase (CCA-adding enzyme)
MQRYLVGGAVRDRLLGLPVQDRDFVVVGATPQDMVAAGYTPVGKDFPVFLHPQTHDEHALARTERKTAPGYRGFVFHADSDVTLEQDLARRDLTINAMAQAEDGTLTDPFGGQRDLQARVLRHVSPAFLEDPVRILRLARFAARFADFSVAPETMQLMRAMVGNGEIDALVPERVWQELARGLMERAPARMFDVLQGCGALARLLPALAAVWPAPAAVPPVPANSGAAPLQESGVVALPAAIDAAGQAGAPLCVRLAVLLQPTALRQGGTGAQGGAPAVVASRGTRQDVTAPIEAACARLKAPSDCRDLALLLGREHDCLLAGLPAPDQALAMLERCDALRKPQRFLQALDAVLFGSDAGAAPAIALAWRCALETACAVDAGAIAAATRLAHPAQPLQIQAAVRAGRLAALGALKQK